MDIEEDLFHDQAYGMDCLDLKKKETAEDEDGWLKSFQNKI